MQPTFAQRLAQSRQAAYNGKRYTPPSYQVGDEIYLSKKLFTDSSSSARPSQKLSVRRIGPFKVIELIAKNAVKIELPKNINIHPVVHVEHTARVHRQDPELTHPAKERAHPYIDNMGEIVIEVERILAHRRRGKGWQFLTLFKNAPLHEAEWKPLHDFVDLDRTITEALHHYYTTHGILSHLH